MKPYVLLFGPKLPITDGMIFEGTKYLLDKAGIHVDEYLVYTDSIYKPIIAHSEPSHIIVMGTPWVWDRCWESVKYKGIVDLFKRYPKAKKLFLGVGSCFPLGKEIEIAQNIHDNRDKLTDIFQDATIITRDSLAYQTLNSFNPITLPCPAFYATHDVKRLADNYDVMFWYDPTIGISGVDFKYGTAALDNYIGVFQNEYRAHKPLVFCASPLEFELAEWIGLPRPELVLNVNRAKLIMSNARYILSGRVHLAVPAYELNKTVELVAVDSRATVLEDVRVDKIISPKAALPHYESILNDFIN